jgi:hypothetical protein
MVLGIVYVDMSLVQCILTHVFVLFGMRCDDGGLYRALYSSSDSRMNGDTSTIQYEGNKSSIDLRPAKIIFTISAGTRPQLRN